MFSIRTKAKITNAMPKRPKSAFMMWLESAREQIKADHPGLKVTEISKKGGELWNGIKDKSVWEEKAMRAKEEYLKELESVREMRSLKADNPGLKDTQNDEPIFNEESDVEDTNTSDSHVTSPASLKGRPAQNTSGPTKRDCLADDSLLSVLEHLKRRTIPEDRWDVFGKYVAMKMRDLPEQQRFLAEKIINDTLFEAELGNLTISQKLASVPGVNQ